MVLFGGMGKIFWVYGSPFYKLKSREWKTASGYPITHYFYCHAYPLEDLEIFAFYIFENCRCHLSFDFVLWVNKYQNILSMPIFQVPLTDFSDLFPYWFSNSVSANLSRQNLIYCRRIDHLQSCKFEFIYLFIYLFTYLFFYLFCLFIYLFFVYSWQKNIT